MPQGYNNSHAKRILQMSGGGEVHHQIVGVTGVVILDRPNALNALTSEIVRSLSNIFAHWKDDLAVDHVVLLSSNPRAFCAGGDVRQVRASILVGDTNGAERFFQDEYLADLAIAEFGKPIIALCDGVVMGGGAGLAQHCSHIIMTETTKFAMPESSIGLFPDVGASLFLGRCPVAVARFLGMTGYVIDAASCIMLGLANAMVPSQKIDMLKNALVGCKAGEIDDIISSYQTDPGFPTLNQHMPSISYIFGGDGTPEDMFGHAKDLMNSRPNDPFVKQVVNAFSEGCPMSIKVFWRLLEVADSFTTADEAISFDFHLAIRMIRRSDFIEGVRALLVDKDKTPKWSPNRLELIDDSLLGEVFNKHGLPPLR